MKKIVLLIAAISISVSSFAQMNIWKINWEMNQGLGNTYDYIDNFSARGISCDASWFIDDNIAFGMSLSWNLLYDKIPRNTYEVNEQVTINGTQWRYNNFTPLLATCGYYFNDAGSVRPYAELGMGAFWSQRITDIGLYEVINNQWMFGLAPAVGVYIPVSDGFGFNIKAKYNVGFAKGNNDLSTFAISLGLAWATF